MEGRLLAAQTQTLDQVLVTRGVLTVQVIEQLAALINHSHTYRYVEGGSDNATGLTNNFV